MNLVNYSNSGSSEEINPLLQPELMCLYQNVAPPSSELAHPLQVYLAWLVAEGVDHWDQGSC